MKKANPFSPARNRTRLILTASIVCAFTLTACWRKSTTAAQAVSVDVLAQPASPIAESKTLEVAVLTMNPAPDTRSALQKAENRVALSQIAGPVTKTRTLETSALGASIDAFIVTPTHTNRASVKQAFARLDSEIAELNERADKTDGRDRAEATAKLINLQSYRTAEMLRFTRAQDANFLERSSKTRLALPIAKTVTVETASLGTAIDSFEDNPSEETQTVARLAFVKLDGAIVEWNGRAVLTDGSNRSIATVVSTNLQQYRDAEMVRFTDVQGRRLLEKDRPADSRSAAQKAEDATAKLGGSVANGARAIGNAIGTAATNTGKAIKNASH